MSGEFQQANARADVVIIGGGVIGLSIARQLALRGLRNVTVIERGEFGKEASWAAGGILAPQVEADRADEFFEMACASRDLYPSFVQAVQHETGIDVEFDQTGTLLVSVHIGDDQQFRERFEWQTKAGFEVEWLTGREARQLEPNIFPSRLFTCALRFPNDWQVDNRKLTEALYQSNRKLGVQLISNSQVTSLGIQAGRITGVDSRDGFIASRSVVIAAGAWSSQISRAGYFAPAFIGPVRGQMLCFQPKSPLARHVIYCPQGYLVPRRDGRLLAGSTTEHVGFEKQVTDQGLESIKSMAYEVVPALKSAAIVDSWAGFRPHSLDDLPVLGPAGDIDGLFYATGHYRNGILLAPITAEIIAEAVVNRKSSPFFESFSPDRFRLAAASP
ncbi:MAG TPA: glycine oxidase ThiO [Pyrinomonadaceae bacterium]|nr:glycine oxidase ThiO [Pyrinomonadaceae bacterium]